ncbi:MAG: hypothetical protein ABEI98_03595 [Halorhabdus sp.]
MVAMVLSVSAVLGNSFADRLRAGEGVDTDFAVGAADDATNADQAATS